MQTWMRPGFADHAEDVQSVVDALPPAENHLLARRAEERGFLDWHDSPRFDGGTFRVESDAGRELV